MGMRSGTSTLGAQYATFIAKCSDEVTRMTDGQFQQAEVVARNGKAWLDKALQEDVDIEKLLSELSTPKEDETYRLSLAQC